MKSHRRKPQPAARRHRKARKVRLDVLCKIMQEQDWDEHNLVALTGLSIQTIVRMCKGRYIRKDSAAVVQKALANYTTAPLFEDPAPPLPDATSEAPPAAASPLETLYQACERQPPALRDHIRVREFAPLIAGRTRGFVGRRWLFAALARFLRQQPCGYFVVRGTPGVGKTAFVAELTRRRGCVHHFNSRFTRLNRTDQFLAGVCAQLIAAYGLPYGSLPAWATQDAGTLTGLLAEAARVRPAEKILVAVDALDEAEPWDGAAGNPLALPPQLPERCYLVLTLRDVDCEPRFESPFEVRYLEQQSEGNLLDVRRFLTRRATRPGIRANLAAQGLSKDSFVRLLEEKSQGNFMYLRYVLPEIEHGRLTTCDWQKLPEGLTNYYESHWALLRDADPAAWFGYKLPILVALATAHEPVSLRLLTDRFPHIPAVTIHDVLSRDWRQFLEREELPLGHASVTGWRLYHASFADFLRDKAAQPGEQIDLEGDRAAWFAYGEQRGIVPD